MSIAPLRLAVALLVLFLLARAGRIAWSQRRLTLLIWRSIRPRHVVGALGLLAAVLGIATALLDSLPVLSHGLGSLVGFSGNAVFAPLEEAAVRAGPPPPSGPDWWLISITTTFLGLLVLLLPWLAFVEEEVFRAGLERATPAREALAALWFGLVHMVMLVPLGAALAIAATGAVYGRIYRAAHAASDGTEVPEPVLRAFRPTRRSAAAADAARDTTASPPAGPGAPTVVMVDRRPERRQAEGILHSAVWHTTFNTLVVALVWVSIVWGAL